MKNIDIVTIEEAKRLKDLGFEERTFHNFYTSNIDESIKLEKSSNLSNWNYDKGDFSFRRGRKWSAPTLKQRDDFILSII